MRLVVVTDRTSNGPHVVYPGRGRARREPASENWVLDSSGATRTRRGDAADRGARRRTGWFSKAEIDAVTARRWDQYEDALRDDRAFQQALDDPDHGRFRRKPVEIDADWGIRPAPLETLEALPAVEEDGVVSYGAADPSGRRLRGPDRHEPAGRARRPNPGQRVRSRRRAVRCRRPRSPRLPPHSPTPGSRSADIDVIKTHNPFAVNDLWFARETGARRRRDEPVRLQPHLRSPAGAHGRSRLIELMWALHDRGGGRGLFTGCAAGDTGAALVIELDG